MPQPKHFAIIGAGPAGLMAAQMLVTAGHRVTVYDRMPSPARKFLLAGRGGLNLTHSEPLESFIGHYGAAASWLSPAIHAFTPIDLRAWCESLGQETFVGSSGRVFPRSMKAVQLLRAWLNHLEQLGVEYRPRHTWHGWKNNALHFTDGAGHDVLVTPDATLLALGGASWPRLGADGGWVNMLRETGVEIANLRPSNCGFMVSWSEHFSNRFAGAPLKPVTITHAGTSRQGEAMITAQGIEGGAIYALSAMIRDAMDANGTATIHLDLRPNLSLGALTQKLQIPRASKSFSHYLRKVGFSPLAISLLREVTPVDQLTSMDVHALAIRAKSLPITLIATAGMARAISSAGGITRTAVNDDFMLHTHAGVFVAGEMLDWEAPTGGYLLQACFSTAVAAAHGMRRYCEA